MVTTTKKDLGKGMGKSAGDKNKFQKDKTTEKGTGAKKESGYGHGDRCKC